MKINIAIILVAGLLGLVGVAGADSQGPTTFMANSSYVDHLGNVHKFDYYNTPANADMYAYDSGSSVWRYLPIRWLNPYTIIGSSSDGLNSYCYDYTIDGTDDAVEINDAIRDGNKHLLFVSDVNIAPGNPIVLNVSGVTMDGFGYTGPTFTLTGSSSGTIVELQASYCAIRNLVFNGNRNVYQAGSNIINWTGDNNQNTIRGCRFSKAGDTAIYIDTATGYSLGGSTITKNYIYDPKYCGIYIVDGNDLRIVDNELGSHDVIGIYVGGSNNLVALNHIWGGSATGAIVSGNYNRLNDNIFGSQTVAVNITGGSYHALHDNTYWNQLTGANTYYIECGGDRVLIDGGTFVNDADAAGAINLTNDSSYCLVHGNMLSGEAVADHGTSNTVTDNKN